MKTRLTEDQAQVHYIKQQLERNGGYCPSVPGSYGQEECRCPCKDFKENAKKGDTCKCGLYVKTKE